MDLSATGPVRAGTADGTPPASASGSAGKDEGKPAAITADFDTFLRMLTVQMQNQDPLNPMKSADFAVQLATFSGVEQQVRTNDLLGQLVAGAGAGGVGAHATWIGMEARVPGPHRFDGAPLALEFDAPPEGAALVVRDEAGLEVGRSDLVPGQRAASWVGLDALGAALPPGLYAFTVEAPGAEAPLPVQSYARVDEIRLDGGTVTAGLAGGATVPVAEVTALRRP